MHVGVLKKDVFSTTVASSVIVFVNCVSDLLRLVGKAAEPKASSKKALISLLLDDHVDGLFDRGIVHRAFLWISVFTSRQWL